MIQKRVVLVILEKNKQLKLVVTLDRVLHIKAIQDKLKCIKI